MSLSSKLTGEFIGVFLIGTLMGALIMWYLTDTQLTQFMTRTNDPNLMLARLDAKYVSDYHLSPDELNRIQPLAKEMTQRVSQIRRQFGIDIISTLDQYHQQISTQLDPEHRAAYDKANDERKKMLTSMLLIDQDSSDQGQK
jgi:hypothetical protein